MMLKWIKQPGRDNAYMARGPGRHYFVVWIVHARTFWQAAHVNNGHVQQMSDLKEGPAGLTELQQWCSKLNRALEVKSK